VRIRRHGFRFRPPIAIEVMDERDERDEHWRPGGRGWKKIRRAVREETFVRRCRYWRASVKARVVTRKPVMLPLIIPGKLPPFMCDISPRRGSGREASPRRRCNDRWHRRPVDFDAFPL
jgi:hypothetical protein